MHLVSVVFVKLANKIKIPASVANARLPVTEENKITWKDLLPVQRKAFGLSCRRLETVLVLEFSGDILTLCPTDALL